MHSLDRFKRMSLLSKLVLEHEKDPNLDRTHPVLRFQGRVRVVMTDWAGLGKVDSNQLTN